MDTHIHIKNMVCPRCILVVRQLLESLEIPVREIRLGEVELESKIPAEKLNKLDEQLQGHGFERIDNRKVQLLEQIKIQVIEQIHFPKENEMALNWSTILSEKLGYDYNYLSSLFSSTEGITLEQYIIRQKMERVKELLIYDQLSVKEIAFTLGFSSVAHLSSQFKKVIGQSPAAFRKDIQAAKNRKPLDGII